jgi:arylsulfatase A-like enzyme
MLDSTLIIFTSDNGPERQTYGYIEKHGHFSMGTWRGIKRDCWEGGHRTPFILSWPGHARPGTTSQRLISQTDILATVADHLGYALADGEAEDSFSFLDELVDGHAVGARRELAVYHTDNNKLALRQGDWVYIDDPTGDRGTQEPRWFREMRGVRPHEEPCELFNLKDDPQQRYNRHPEQAERARRMKEALTGFIASGRTAPRRG